MPDTGILIAMSLAAVIIAVLDGLMSISNFYQSFKEGRKVQ